MPIDSCGSINSFIHIPIMMWQQSMAVKNNPLIIHTYSCGERDEESLWQ